MSNVTSYITGKSRQLDRRVSPGQNVNADDVADPSKLARLLTTLVAQLFRLSSRFWPRRTDFEDITFGSGTLVTLTHKFGGRVRWWVVDQEGNFPALLKDATETTKDALVLSSGIACVATIRVEEAG